MRACMLLVLIGCLALTAYGQPREVEWQPQFRLSYSDFTGVPLDSIAGPAHVEIVISFHLNTLQIFRKRYNQNVGVHFSSDNSFLRSRDSSTLAFAQSLFDLSEIMAKELRKEFSTHRHRIYSQKAHEIYDSLSVKYSGLREKYTQESSYGANQESQAQWEKWIELQQFELRDFDKHILYSKTVSHNGPPRYHKSSK